MPKTSSPPSPVDGMPGTKLEARVVRPGSEPLLHGYDVQGDLARHFTFAEMILTALTGEAPTEEAGRAMAVALIFAAPISVAEAPSHAATLARRCGADHRGVFGVAAIALAEQAHHAIAHLEAEPSPGRHEADPAIARLVQALADRGIEIRTTAAAPSLWAAIVEVFRFCGLTRRWQLECAIALARLPVTVAEALSVERGALMGYPMRLPSFAYRPEGQDG